MVDPKISAGISYYMIWCCLCRFASASQAITKNNCDLERASRIALIKKCSTGERGVWFATVAAAYDQIVFFSMLGRRVAQ